MDVKETARTAKDYLLDLFEGEEIMNVGLEEIDFDDSQKNWSVTIGFWRPWDYSNKSPMTPTLFEELSQPLTRSFKIVRINDQSGRVLSVKDRMLTHSTQVLQAPAAAIPAKASSIAADPDSSSRSRRTDRLQPDPMPLQDL